MATSESDDFESADEEMAAFSNPVKRQKRHWASCGIGSDSDDDVDYIPIQYQTTVEHSNNLEKMSLDSDRNNLKEIKTASKTESNVSTSDVNVLEISKNLEHKCSVQEKEKNSTKDVRSLKKKERPERPRRPKESRTRPSLGATKLGTKITPKLVQDETPSEIKKRASEEGKSPPIIQECWEECDDANLGQTLENENKDKELPICTHTDEWVPDELKSNLKFKDIFKPDGWEALGDDVELPEDFSDDKFKPVLDKLAKKESRNVTSDSWSSWGSWGVSSLMNSASAGVSTLTSHVSHGLSILEETMGLPDPAELAKTDHNTLEEKLENKDVTSDDSSLCQTQSSFGLGNLISGVSSITKLVESTGTKVISGGLDTLETIGKKTMQVLQEGDPGLKKKRAYFTNETEKPILSKILREAKEKADLEEKVGDEMHLAKKVRFETLFDDYHGLVHLEALEMLSKQCNMKIQQQLVNLDGSELTSIQETLEEIKELCDIGDEEEDDENDGEEINLNQKLQQVSEDLGVSITFDKLSEAWNEIHANLLLPEATKSTQKELFQSAISALAQFTAYSVERFHRSAELLLIKERRSTVSEAYALVQLTKYLACQVGEIAAIFCNQLNEIEEDEVNPSITTIFFEATNASSYIQEAFRLLIPILQVGAV